MKLVIIVISLFLERFFIHHAASKRFEWFSSYCDRLRQFFGKSLKTQSTWLWLGIYSLPLLLIVGFALLLLGKSIFGVIGLVINFLVFYYCIGAENVFYPLTDRDSDDENTQAGRYLSRANNQVFAVIFWFLLFGALGALAYRLIDLCRKQEPAIVAATQLKAWLDWVTVRVTLLLYLLVGNFQRGFSYYKQKFLTSPQTNDDFLMQGGLLAAQPAQDKPVSIPEAQYLIEHALIIFLVIIAFFTLTL